NPLRPVRMRLTKLESLNTRRQVIKPRATALNIQIGTFGLALAVFGRVRTAIRVHALNKRLLAKRRQLHRPRRLTGPIQLSLPGSVTLILRLKRLRLSGHSQSKQTNKQMEFIHKHNPMYSGTDFASDTSQILILEALYLAKPYKRMI
ncbi:MAG: hypothetical protein U5M23_14685, partial [Marinagarivorans sp.]|nr:hypothetical protein [Marinagarivorans sp.]